MDCTWKFGRAEPFYGKVGKKRKRGLHVEIWAGEALLWEGKKKEEAWTARGNLGGRSPSYGKVGKKRKRGLHVEIWAGGALLWKGRKKAEAWTDC